MNAFLAQFGNKNGGLMRTDQGGELARSTAFREAMLKKKYIVEPTGADSPSQNGRAEIWNHALDDTVRVLLYSSSMPAQYWSAAILHAVYLYNRRCHHTTLRTPFESWTGIKPNLRHLKVFGSRVCVRRTRRRRAKLDRNDFQGIFLGYTASDKNIRYLDLITGLVKTSHHAIFDKAWYTYSQRPPAAEFLNNLGLSQDTKPTPGVLYHPMFAGTPHTLPVKPPSFFKQSIAASIPIPEDDSNSSKRGFAAAAAKVDRTVVYNTVLSEFNIGKKDMAMVYLSLNPYHEAFEEQLDLKRFSFNKHPTTGICLTHHDGHMLLAEMSPSTPAAKIPRWRSRLCGV